MRSTRLFRVVSWTFDLLAVDTYGHIFPEKAETGTADSAFLRSNVGG
jgi:hypothetical protein